MKSVTAIWSAIEKLDILKSLNWRIDSDIQSESIRFYLMKFVRN